MSTLLATLNEDMKTALRARETERLSTIRLLISEVKNARIAAMHDLSDDEVINVLRKQAKMRLDSIEQFRKGGREDLALKEEAELAVIDGYLPAAPSAQQIRDVVRSVIAESGATSVKDLGVVMRSVMSRLGSQVDGRQVQGIVREELTSTSA